MLNNILEILFSNPDLAKSMISELINKYKPLAYSVANELFEIYKDFSNNNEYFKTIAILRKNQFDAYISVGFTKEESMNLLLNDIKKLSETISKSTSKINVNKV